VKCDTTENGEVNFHAKKNKYVKFMATKVVTKILSKKMVKLIFLSFAIAVVY